MKQINSILIFSYAIFLVQANCIFNCSYNGFCINNQCSCNQDYIGYFCQAKAFPLKKGVPLSKNVSGTYYVYHTFTKSNPTPEHLYFKFNNEQSSTVQVQIIELKNWIIEYQDKVYVSSGRSVSLNLSPEMIGNQLIIKIEHEYSSDFTITYGNQEEDQTTSDIILILTITLPIVLIFIIAIIFAYCFKRIKSMWQKRYPQRFTQSRNPVYLEQNYTAPQQMIMQYQQQPVLLINHNEECSLCLQPLLNGMPKVITPCLHKYHRDCIFQFLMRQQSCPNCRSYLQPNQLEGLPLPNQIPIQLEI